MYIRYSERTDYAKRPGGRKSLLFEIGIRVNLNSQHVEGYDGHRCLRRNLSSAGTKVEHRRRDFLLSS